MIYLDNAATTRPDPSVIQAMMPYLTEQFANPSAFYQEAVRVRMQIDLARQHAADLLGAAPGNIYFTAGGTEADNWALRAGAEMMREKGRHIITSSVEHPAVRNTARYLASCGYEVTFLPVDGRGRVDPDEVRAAIRPDTVLISVMHANNELGTIEPVREIGMAAREAGVLFHTDAVQTFGHIPIDPEECGISFLSASAHKLNGPKGVGLLYVAPGLRPGRLLYGGSQERSLRPGTENPAAIIGFGEAARLAALRMDEDAARIRTLRQDFIMELKSQIPGIRINGDEEQSLPGIVSVTFPTVSSETLLIRLDQHGICASAGSACSAGAIEPSPVLTACGMSEEQAKRTLRLSLGRENTAEELKETVRVLRAVLSES